MHSFDRLLVALAAASAPAAAAAATNAASENTLGQISLLTNFFAATSVLHPEKKSILT